MDWERVKAGIIDKGIIALLAGALGVVITSGLNGQMASDIAEIKRSVSELKASAKMQDDFTKCTELRLFAFENRVKPPPCPKGN